ncbi:MAG: hypothetical protein ABR881_15060 [Candidatus Sulfotelmatobacter sp.]
MDDSILTLIWDGEANHEVRLRFTIKDGTPTVQDLSLRVRGARWITLAANLTPEFRVVTGLRRLPSEQIIPLLSAKVKITPEVVEENKFDAFWDAPLRVPGSANGPYTHSILGWMPPAEGVGGLPGLPRKPEEINRATAVYSAAGCDVRTNGDRMEISFPGVRLGVFSGKLQYTVYKGTNLIRQEVIVKTEEPSVAYKYDAGLDGLTITPESKIVWHDTANNWQAYDFDGPANEHEFDLLAANRLIAAELKGGSIATFPPPHTFFWARELAVNLGYNWYRKDGDSVFSFGIREPESEADPAYAGRGPGDYRECFALKSARPGTWQRMPVYFYVSSESAQPTLGSALAFTRDDHFKDLPGYLVMAAHFHPYLALQLQAFGKGLNSTLPDVEALKAAGINIYAPSDGGSFDMSNPPFRGSDLASKDELGNSLWSHIGLTPGSTPDASVKDAALRHVKNLGLYYKIASLHSGKNFWILPAEEITSGNLANQLGGHTDLLVSHPVFWGQGRADGQPLVEQDSQYGKIYHIGNPADFMEMVHREDLLVFEPHPRSKASAGYPDAIKDTAYFRDEDYRGFGFRWGMGLDGSEQRLCDYRCLPLLDETNNWIADLPTPPKYLEAISELHVQRPGDDVYANNPVSYVKVDRLPTVDNWAPVIDSMRRGNFFVTSGEVLIPAYAVQGTGERRTITADLEWTFPLEFVEVVWGDGQHTDRQIISATDLPAFGRHHFEIPFNAAGKKWVRFAAWDSAGNGALVQPIKLSQDPSARN